MKKTVRVTVSDDRYSVSRDLPYPPTSDQLEDAIEECENTIAIVQKAGAPVRRWFCHACNLFAFDSDIRHWSQCLRCLQPLSSIDLKDADITIPGPVK